MALVYWHPRRETEFLQRQITRLFEDALVPRSGQKQEYISTVPLAEMQETPEAIHLKLEIPGMEAKDIDVQVTEDAVSISGERKSAQKSEDKGVTKTEFRYGRFERLIPLPVRIQHTNVKAEYKDGILNLTLPKTEQEKNKVVKVQLEPAA
ncbi:MAG: Hsp20/alpha crystallin family protein [Coleofasciculus sp. G3-WIS-01]|uniref:Hsp20/alpha crystallin family protein n=1 Tax=Coleofasciculus sp. G3-WIS-01 TaxID=3069528 RepID=UPI0032F62757